MNLKIQSNSKFWEHCKKAIVKKLIEIYSILMEMQKELSWIDKFQKSTVLST